MRHMPYTSPDPPQGTRTSPPSNPIPMPSGLCGRVRAVNVVKLPESRLEGLARSFSEDELREQIAEYDRLIGLLDTAKTTAVWMLRLKLAMNGEARESAAASSASADDGHEVGDDRPNLSEAIRIVLGRSDGPMKVGEILRELTENGWEPRAKNKRSALEARLHKLKQRDRVEHVGPGTFRLPTVTRPEGQTAPP